MSGAMYRKPAAVLKAVNPPATATGQRRPVLGQRRRPGPEPPHLPGRGCLRADCTPANCTPADTLAHDGIKGGTVSIANVFTTRQPPMERLPPITRLPPINRLPEQPVEPVDGVLSPATVAQCRRGGIRQPERVTKLALHQQTTVRTGLRAAKFQPHPAVEIHPIAHPQPAPSG